MSETPPDQPRPGIATAVAAITGLAAVAVAQPILQVVGSEPQFFVAHDLGALEVALFPLLLVVGACLLPLLVVVPTHLVAPGAARWMAAAAMGALSSLVALHIGATLEWSTIAVGAAALAVGGAVLTAYATSETARRSSLALLALPPIVVAWFWLTVSGDLLGGDGEAIAAAQSAPYDVVILILDELPTSSILDGDGELRGEALPGFARLAADGTWYRNAITVETGTSEAVPAILSGIAVADGTAPVAAAHPGTLMALLRDTHGVSSLEAITDLCPDDVCEPDPTPVVDRWRRLTADLGILFGHLVAPPSLADELPPIDAAWAGFGDDEADSDPTGYGGYDLDERLAEARRSDRRAFADRFLASLEAEDRPQLSVGHLMLPHRPWVFLPDGSTYDAGHAPGYISRGWGPDWFFVADGWRRHLLQVEYADTVVDRVLDTLERSGRYDSTMVVVLADHGVAFLPDIGDMRATLGLTAGSILPVPFFVKYPTEVEEAPPPGSVVDDRVTTLDVVPTVMDVLDADLPSSLPEAWEGRSLLDPGERPAVTVFELRGEPFRYGAGIDDSVEIAARREGWFGGGMWDLAPDSGLQHLLGRPLARLELDDDPQRSLRIDRAGVVVEGTLDGFEPGASVVVAGDNTVVAITKAFDDDGRTGFTTLVEPAVAESVERWSAWVAAPGEPGRLRR